MQRILVYVATVAALHLATPASAQPPASIELGFGPGIYAVDADEVSGAVPAFSASVRVRLTPNLSLEGDLWRPSGRVSRQYSGPSIAFVPAPVLPDEFVITDFTNQRRTAAVLSGGTAFHPARPFGRFEPRLFVGITLLRVEDRRLAVHVVLPPGVTLARANAAIAPEERQSRTLGALTIGTTLAVRLTDRLAIAPDVRYDYGSIGDEINNTLRTSFKVLLSF